MLWLIIFLTFLTSLLTISVGLCIYKLNLIRQLKQNVELKLADEIRQNSLLDSELKELQKNTQREEMQDALTQLPSRKVLEDRLVQTINQSQRYHLTFGVMFLDIDSFKVINDALGYEVGDELLKKVAERLQESIRQVDTVGRFAGDEFVLILPQLSKAETAAYVAQRILDVLAQPFEIREQELFITASIGIAIFPSDGTEAKNLLQNAHNALHQAKARGRNTYQFYQEEMHALSKRELILNSSLRGASIYRDFTLHYQPQFNLATNKMTTLDVSLHWQHPDFGSISLQDFFRLAENSGKIIMIGEWMLKTALNQLSAWKKQNFPFEQIMVTISLRQLENPHFSFKISQLLQEAELEPTSLILKITEGNLLKKPELIEKSLFMLKHLGVQIAIDEFGTGNLALQHIKRLPADYIKLDKSLVEDITVNQESEAIVKMIMALAKSLQINVIANGVDTARQKRLLRDLGCQVMQGALFADAQTAEQVTKITV